MEFNIHGICHKDVHTRDSRAWESRIDHSMGLTPTKGDVYQARLGKFELVVRNSSSPCCAWPHWEDRCPWSSEGTLRGLYSHPGRSLRSLVATVQCPNPHAVLSLLLSTLWIAGLDSLFLQEPHSFSWLSHFDFSGYSPVPGPEFMNTVE